MVDAQGSASDGRIVTEIKDHVFYIGIDRPKKLNAFTPEMFFQLSTAFTDYEANDTLWCALLHARGKHFTAGLQLDAFDITQALSRPGLVDPFGLHHPRRSKPLVTAVQGICFTAGVELMLASDVVIAADNCRFAQLEVKRGLMAFGGATMRMVDRAGWGNAMRYLLTGDEFDAIEARRLGFVQEVIAQEHLFSRALEIAERIAAQAPLAVRETRRSAEIHVDQGLDAAVAAYDTQLKGIFASEDFAEGVRSFLERRDAKFQGR